jgi:predicted amidohydrolase YtcJ
MTADLILKAASIITMNNAQPRAEAIAVDSAQGKIMAVGTVTQCHAAAPGVEATDLGDSVLMPGFIEAHSHPVASGVFTEPPAYWISRPQGYATYEAVQNLWRKIDATLPPGQPVMCWGLDRMGQGAPELSSTDLDAFFPHRPAFIFDISGHEAYFNTAVMEFNKWPDHKPPADPPASRFGRNADGTSNGRAYETAAVLLAVNDLRAAAVPDPLMSVARWFRTLAQAGVTTSADHSYAGGELRAYEALLGAHNTPLRIAAYHVASDPACTEPIQSSVPADRLWKAGVKLWSDGAPFNGTLAASFPFLDNETTQRAQIPLGPGSDRMLNYTRSAMDAVLHKVAGTGLQVATHAHGDVGIDLALESYACVLASHGMLGTDHRWRIEHWSAGRADQLRRAVELGICTPMAAYQFIYFGDLLDGTLFPAEIGARWVAAADAIKAGSIVSFHSDSPVSPVNPLLDVQSMSTRRVATGSMHGPEQAISLDDALRAITINAAYHLRREHDLGSVEVGKLADLVELSADPYAVDPGALSENVKVLGTWSAGRKVDLDAFMTEISQIDPAEHADLHQHVTHPQC